MNLILLRRIYTPTTTIGDLIVNHKVFCYTLEDTVRAEGVKKPGATAIPALRYYLTVNHSKRFKRLMPLLCNVPNFDGIRMHGGNTAKDTAGCILVAYNLIDSNTIQGSAEHAITEILLNTPGEHTIEIINTFHNQEMHHE
jgi:hypothetical protein